MRTVVLMLWAGVLLVLNVPLYAESEPTPLLHIGEKGPVLVYDNVAVLDLNFTEQADVAAARVHVNGQEMPGVIDAARQRQKIRVPVETGKSVVEVSVQPKGKSAQNLISQTQIHQITIIRAESEVKADAPRRYEFKSPAHKAELIERLMRGEDIPGSDTD